MSLSSNKNKVQCRLLAFDVADELAVEMDDREADVDAWVGR
jgi:hypothetical protein